MTSHFTISRLLFAMLLAAVALSPVLVHGEEEPDEAVDPDEFEARPLNYGEPLTREAAEKARGSIKPALLKANQEFAADLFKRLAEGKEQQGKNILVSPYCISAALYMLYNGAAGDTRKGMDKAMHLGGLSLEDMNASALGLRQWLSSQGDTTEILCANSLWGRPGLEFGESFLTRAKDFHDAKLSPVPLNNEGAKIINDWISEQTKGKIKDMVSQLPPDMVLSLVSALYFRGYWERKFDKSLTEDGDFKLLGGDAVKRKFMKMGVRHFAYGEAEDYQAISLDFGELSKNTILIVLPSEKSSITGFMSGFSSTKLASIEKGLGNRKGTLKLPRFKVNFSVELSATLAAMGMDKACSQQQANFKEMGIRGIENNVWIDSIQHQACISIDEDGAEGAAAVLLYARGGAGMERNPPPPFQMTCDRPFFFVIRDADTATPLFMGIVHNPLQE